MTSVSMTWRDLALQFDENRIEARSLLRALVEARTMDEALAVQSQAAAFLKEPPLPAEAVLNARIAAMSDHNRRASREEIRDLAKRLNDYANSEADPG